MSFTVCTCNLSLPLLPWLETLGRKRNGYLEEVLRGRSLKNKLIPLQGGEGNVDGCRSKIQSKLRHEQKMGEISLWQEAMKVYPHPHVLFSKSSSSEIIALNNNWGMLSGSWYKWSRVQFGEICYAQLPSIHSSGSDVPDLLLGILWNRLLFTAVPLKDEIHEQELTGQKITIYVSTYLLSAAKNLVSSAPGIWLHTPVSVLPGNICRGTQICVMGLG